MNVLERFARGDAEAFEALFREHQAGVYRWCLRIVRDHAAAEDLTMDSFYRAYRAHAHFDPNGNFPGWMRRIATNLALDHLRAAKRNVPFEMEGAAAVSEKTLAEASAMNPGVMRRAPEVADANPAMLRETRDEISAAFAGLAPKLRVVATL